ncbi:MAG: rod shape-determining protein, partial [Atribacterota bacterium]|nr:rod shape-determining protein [Atribacterota bacterium]
PEEVIEVAGIQGQKKASVSKKYLVDIIEARVHEMFSLIREELERSNNYHLITQGVVLTGGCALLPGITELAGKVFETNVRLGRPEYKGELGDLINEPRLSTVMGLIDFAVEIETIEGSNRRSRRGGNTIFAKITNWLRDFF